MCAWQVMLGLDQMLSKLLDPDATSIASAKHSKFVQKEGLLGSPNAIANASKLPAWKWWLTYGTSVPELQSVALKVLAQCSSACSCERNWSTYGFIHSKSRNRLKPARAKDLVFVFSNLRLLRKMDDLEYEEMFPVWDSSDEESDRE